MDFFGIGMGEVLLILVVALIIWGPKRLPEISRTIGKAMRTFKKSTRDFTSQVTRELDMQDTGNEEKERPSQRKQDSSTRPESDRAADGNSGNG